MINILLVDDDKNNRFTLELLLEDIDGVKISEACNGEEAVRLCKDKKYNLIFMDIMMPVMDGITATREIKKISKSTMIIALSALEDKESKHKMLKAGAEDYIEKPINAELFLQRTKNYLNILNLRNIKIKNINAINPFTASVYDRLLVFKIKDESSLVQFWDYFLQKKIYNCTNLSDYIRVIYGLGLWLMQHNEQITIYIEESDKKLYIIVDSLFFLRKDIAQNIIKRHLSNVLFKIENNILSFELEKTNCVCGESFKEENQEIVEEKITKVEETQETITSKPSVKIQTTVDKSEIDSMHYSDAQKTSAKDFLKDFEVDSYVMDDLVENEKDMQNLFSYDAKLSEDILEATIKVFLQYGHVLNETIEFKDIAYSMESLTTVLNNVDIDALDDSKKSILRSYIEGIEADLSSWREHIFVLQDTPDIHYLDASLLDNCAEIERFILSDSEDEDEDEGELDFF